MCYPGTGAYNYAIENGIVVEFLPMLAFKLPARLTVIEEEAFKGIDAEKVIIPAGVISIGANAFADCENLMLVVFEGNQPATSENSFPEGVCFANDE